MVKTSGEIGQAITKALAKETFPVGISFDPVGNLKNQASLLPALD